jgi:hypothetical protein
VTGYWAIVALAAIEGGVRVYRMRSERLTTPARLRAAAERTDEQ